MEGNYQEKIHRAKVVGDREKLRTWGRKGGLAAKANREAMKRTATLENIKSELERRQAVLESNEAIISDTGEPRSDDYKEQVEEYIESLRDELEKITGSRHIH